jgi:hypothetical protein
MNQIGLQSCPAPAVWSVATVRLAMEFARGKSQAIAGTGAAAVPLAETVVRALFVAKMKFSAAITFSLAILVSGAAAWAIRELNARAPAAVTATELAAGNSEAPLAAEKAQPAQADEVRTIRGIVRDEQGRPVAKA